MEEKGFFKTSRPVWAKGLEQEINVTCGFYTCIEKRENARYEIRLAASCFYRLFVNGKFLYYGPARCAHGFYRVDELDVTEELTEGKNHLAIEVVGYNVNGFYSLDQPSFLQAEVFEDGQTLAATTECEPVNQLCEGEALPAGRFFGFRLRQRRQKIQKFSFQRAIGESYVLFPGVDDWRVGRFEKQEAVCLALTEEKRMIARGIDYNVFSKAEPDRLISTGKVRTGVKPRTYIKDRSLTNVSSEMKGFPEAQLELHLSDEIQEFQYYDWKQEGTAYAGKNTLPAGSFAILSLPVEKSGFVGMEIDCKEESVFYFMVDEALTNGDVDPLRMQCLNVIRFDVQPGTYSFLSFEVFGFKYLKLVCTKGAVDVSGVHVREYRYPKEIISSEIISSENISVYSGRNEKLKAIYQAAVETFCQNAPDVFMDCPTRERAGWLCDSFFTARVEKLFTGGNQMEKEFLRNFLLPDTFKCLPKGMLPMCYPSDHYDRNFIPNWAMWFVIELEDYVKRTQDREFALLFRDRVYDLLAYFKPFENELGLLEKLEAWVFVEWSKANELVQDVNYPTNMVYCGALKAAGKLFDDPALIEQAEKLADVIRERSFDGEWFVDNEVRTKKGLVSSGERTETCQYYAFFFEIAVPEKYPKLWKRLTEEFGPDRQKLGLYPEIYPSNAFIGNYLRLDVLVRYGLKERCLEEMEGYFYYMAEKTGTLWENITESASCNHGFASYAAYLISCAQD